MGTFLELGFTIPYLQEASKNNRSPPVRLHLLSIFLKPIFLPCLRVFLMINLAHEHVQWSAVYTVAAIECLINAVKLLRFCVHDRTRHDFILVALEVIPHFSALRYCPAILGTEQSPLLLNFFCLFHQRFLPRRTQRDDIYDRLFIGMDGSYSP